jgi:thioredoxin 1
VGDPLPALPCELGEAVLLDLALRAEAEGLLDLDLHPQSLGVEAVLIALVEAAKSLVALKDVLQGPAVAVVHAGRIVGRDRPVHEGERGAACILLAELPERLLAVPAFEDPLLEGGMVGHRRQRLEDFLGHREAKSRAERSYLWEIGYRSPTVDERKRMATDVTNATFESEVLESGEPVLVDFWAEWCGPCHAVSPVLERIAEERNLKLVKVNIDENQDLAMRYGIQSIPNMILFEAGQPKANAVGAMPKGMLERSLGLGE